MRILAIEQELTALDTHQHRDLLREEAACVWMLMKKEIIRDIWFTRSDRRAVLMLECSNEEEATQHLQSLPLVRESFIKFEVLGLRSYDGLDRLTAAR